jgi:hypothetical protein
MQFLRSKKPLKSRYRPNQCLSLDALTVIGTEANKVKNTLLTSPEEVRSADVAQIQTFTYETVTTQLSQSISITVGNTQEKKSGHHDSWNLSVTVQNPFTVSPYKIVHSNVKAHAQN